MKKTITLLFFAAACCSGKAQSLLNKVPANAVMAVKYSGDNLSKNVPLKKLGSYNFVKNNLYKMLKIDSLESLESTGINFAQDACQYVTMDDSCINFTSLFSISNKEQFLKLVQASYHAEMKPVMKNGFEFLGISGNTYIGWNDKQAVLVYSNYQNKGNYYDYKYSTAAADSAVAIVDSAASDSAVQAAVDSAVAAVKAAADSAAKANEIKKGKSIKKQKETAKTKTSKGKTKKTAPKKKAPVQEEEKIEEIVEAPIGEYNYDTTGQAAREAWEKEQDKYYAAKQSKNADSIINIVFNSNNASIETEPSYKKTIDPAANVSVWLNYDNLLYQYWNYIFKGWRSIVHYPSPSAKYADNSQNKGFRTGMNIYFEKDKMRMEQKMFTPDDQMAAIGRDVYNSRQSPALAGLINPGHIAYLSASINTEAMANYYYKLIRQYLGNYPYTREHADMIDVYMDFLEIIIDEKAIAEVMPGNMVMVLHNMKTKTVTYTDYTYDENFKATETKKTREELSPDFTFAMETKKEAFLKKIANLPLKYAEKEKFNYKEKGGYYELSFDEGKYPLSSLYFIVNGGRAIITSSKEVVDMALANKSYELDAASKNSVLNNNMAMRIDTKKMIQQINPQLTSSASKKISQYFEDNMSDVKMEGGIKDGMMYSTATMGITGNHANSLEFFFNMIDEVNSIMEKDKEEREKKVD